MLSHRLLAATFALFLAFNTTSFAQTAPPAGQMRLPEIKHAPLTTDKIQNLLKSMPAMRAFGQQHKLGKLSKSAPGDPNTALEAYIKANNLTDKLKSMLGNYGFSGMKEWTQVMQSVTMAFGFVKSGKSVSDMKSEMQNMISKLQADQNMQQDQKANLIAMFKQQMSIILRIAPPPENIAAVRKMMPQIEQTMGRK